jgi:hypothetical protein
MRGAFTICMAMSANGVRTGMGNMALKSRLTLSALREDRNAFGVGERGEQRPWSLGVESEAVAILHICGDVVSEMEK